MNLEQIFVFRCSIPECTDSHRIVSEFSWPYGTPVRPKLPEGWKAIAESSGSSIFCQEHAEYIKTPFETAPKIQGFIERGTPQTAQPRSTDRAASRTKSRGKKRKRGS